MQGFHCEPYLFQSVMSDLLTICLAFVAVNIATTVALLIAPVGSWEIALWHSLRIHSLRKWITRKRNVHEPFQEVFGVARKNLLWHLLLTCLFCFLVGRALGTDRWWLQVPAALLVIPSAFYLLGSFIQRQKIAIIRTRQRQTGRYASEFASR